MGELYKNAPLIEAVFEITFPPELSIETKRDEFYKKIRNEFPEINLPLQTDQEPYPLKNYLFRDTKREKGVAYSINKFSYRCYKYYGFARFKEESLRHLKMFAEYFGIKNLERTGLRYVNHIPILSEDGVIPVERYLHFGYKLPESIPEKYNLLHSVIFVRLGKGNLRILIQYVKRPDPPDPLRSEIILLDFDYFLEGKLSSANIETYLDDSHQHTKKIFEDLTTEEYKVIMRQEP